MSSDMNSFQAKLGSSRRVLAIIGAGISASSGLPTFRGSGGLWRRWDATELATPEAFEVDPGLVWQFYSYRRQAALNAQPNSAHYALARLAKRWGPDKFLTLSQNVDGLCERAGHPKEGLVHLHGDLFTLRCTSFSCRLFVHNSTEPLTPALGRAVASGESTEDLGPEDLPRCSRCRSLMRPGVTWFGEALPYSAIQRAEEFISTNEVDLILVIGMSATVWPAAGYIDEVASRGGKVAVFNTDPDAKRDGWYFEGDAAEWLPRALEPAVGRSR